LINVPQLSLDYELLLGVWGETLCSFANGNDASPVRKLGEESVIKSVGNSTTTVRDLANNEDVKLIIYVLAESDATLAWLGGGSLAAGGMGVAGGMAVLGGIIAAPVLAIGGMLFASKAKENLANARSDRAKARKAAEEMKTAMVKLEAIGSIAEMFRKVIGIVDKRMTGILNNLEQSLAAWENREKDNFINGIKSFLGIKIHPNYATMSLDEQQTLHLSYQVAQVMKILLETPLLVQDGNLRPEDEFERAFMNIMAIDSSQKLLPELTACKNGDTDPWNDLFAEANG
jgi:hypothetical protein